MKFNTQKSSRSLDKYLSFIAARLGAGDFGEYAAFLRLNNVAEPVEAQAIKVKGQERVLDFFLGRSKDEDEDLIAVNQGYTHRIPASFIAIASINEVDFICLGKDAGIYYWDRDNNDLYLDPERPNQYLPQNKKLAQVARSFNAFVQSLYRCDDSSDGDGDEPDGYDNPATPFPDEEADFYARFPALFFKQMPEAIAVQLEKLKLSNKGKALLALFSEKGLL
jgi:hypothetical protein